MDFVLESHRFISAKRSENVGLPPGVIPLDEQQSARETTILARIELPFFDSRWSIEQPTLEEIVMAYLRQGAPSRPVDDAGSR
jgi:hypothetical protein